eukprot:2282024-Prymnesium_polylepis.1
MADLDGVFRQWIDFADIGRDTRNGTPRAPTCTGPRKAKAPGVPPWPLAMAHGLRRAGSTSPAWWASPCDPFRAKR